MKFPSTRDVGVAVLEVAVVFLVCSGDAGEALVLAGGEVLTPPIIRAGGEKDK